MNTLSLKEAVERIRQRREAARLQYGSQPIDYFDREWQEAVSRYPHQEDQAFNRARIEAAQHRDARDLGVFFEAVRRLTFSWVPPVETMHEVFDYNN
jgi:hypothetical protein